MEPAFFTLLVPTRDRGRTLAASLRTLLEQDYPHFEVIVSDNCSVDATRAVVDACLPNPRLRYINPGRRLSMSGNFEFALSHVRRDGFVFSLGDDDGLVPGALSRASELIGTHAVQALACNSVYYPWPDANLDEGRSLMIVRDRRSTVTLRNGREEIRKLIAFGGGERGYVWGLPGLYRGFVHTDVIERVRRANGRYFNSITPDAYSAFANALFLDRYLFASQSLTISGVSGSSNGASQMQAVSSSEETKYLQENDIAFHPRLAYAPVTPIIMGESFLQVKELFPAETAGLELDVQAMCAAAMEAAVPRTLARVRAAVDDITARNGSAAPVARHGPARRLAFYAQAVVDAYFMVTVDCEREGIRDVHECAQWLGRGPVQQRPHVHTGLSVVAQEVSRKLWKMTRARFR